MLAAGRGDQEIDGACQHTFLTARRAELGCSGVGRAIKIKEREWVKKLYQSIELFVGPKPVQEFLEDIAEKKYAMIRFEVSAKRVDVNIRIIDPWPPEHERPDRGINDEIHDLAGPSCSPSPFGNQRFPGTSEAAVGAGAG